MPTDKGGRKNSIYNNFKPNFSFHTKHIFCGEIKLLEQDEIKPGEIADVNIHLLPAITIPNNLTINDSFTILEGNRVIGFGIIKSLQKSEKEFEEMISI